MLVIEDLISTGGSSIKAAKALENETGGEVVAIVSIMNYMLEKAKVLFEEESRRVFSLTNFLVLGEVAKERGVISDLDMVMKFREDPANWANSVGITL